MTFDNITSVFVGET